MPTYRTFLRSSTDWKSFGSARKITQETGLTYSEAQSRCDEYKKNRTSRQMKRGTMLEFTVED